MALRGGGGQRMLGGDGQIGGAHQGVGAGGVNLDVVGMAFRQPLAAVLGYLKTHGHAARFADPVALHGFDLLRPIQAFQIVEQRFGVIGDFEVVHRDFALFHHRARSPAAPVDHLLVGQHGLIDRIPVYRAEFFVNHAFFKQLGKQELLPAVILGRAGGQLALPVDAETQAFELAAHIGDVFVSPFGRRGAVFQRRVFGGHAEGVPTHRLHHVKAVQKFEAGKDVADGVVAHMPHMQLAAGVGKHGKTIKFGFGRVFFGMKDATLRPRLLRGRFGERRLVVLLHGFRLPFGVGSNGEKWRGL